MKGSIAKVVSTFGSAWGRIKPTGEERQIFFNDTSLADGIEFASLQVGQPVEFEEHTDQINGSHAERVVVEAV